VKCSKCGVDLSHEGKSGPVASISGSVMGDEISDAYFFCDHCQVYTRVGSRDVFCGEEQESVGEMLTSEEGDAKIALIMRCARPWDKKCRCAAHRKYFGSWLD
jgi:hypothetical protein